MYSNIKRWVVCLVAIALLGMPALAATYISDTLDGQADPDDWAMTDDNNPGLGPLEGTFQDAFTRDSRDGIGIDTVGAGEGGDTDRIYQDGQWATGGGEGDWTALTGLDGGVLSVSFDFYTGNTGAGQGYPGSLQFFIADGNNFWYYTFGAGTLSGLTEDTWTTLSFAFDGGAGWSGIGTFSSVIQSIDEYGWVITYNNDAGQEYGFDNLQLHYPEPGTYAVLAFALLSLGVTFRGKLRERIEALRSS